MGFDDVGQAPRNVEESNALSSAGMRTREEKKPGNFILQFCPYFFFAFCFFFFAFFFFVVEFFFGFLVLVLGLKNMWVEGGRLCCRWCSVHFPFRRLFPTHWLIQVI